MRRAKGARPPPCRLLLASRRLGRACTAAAPGGAAPGFVGRTTLRLLRWTGIQAGANTMITAIADCRRPLLSDNGPHTGTLTTSDMADGLRLRSFSH